MDLKEFVSKTLAEIAEGVSLGAKAAEAFGAVVNPGAPNMNNAELLPEPVNVEFTIGLTVTDDTKGTAGIGVVTGIFKVGAQGEKSGSSESTTHIKFTIPTILPSPIKRGNPIRR